MGLRGVRPRGRGGHRVLLLPSPDATGMRIEAERAVRRLGGVLAMAPSQADVLLEAGELTGALRAAADALWAQVPEPGSRLVVRRAGRVEDELRAEFQRAPGEWATSGQAAEDEQTVDEPEPEPEAEDDGMEMPAGLPMADRAADRDGLTLDVLHLPLGPFLPHWPAGLVVDVQLQGDVVQQAHARGPAARALTDDPFWGVTEDQKCRLWRTAAAHLDSLGRLLAVAGWRSAALGASALRDRLLYSPQDADRTGDFERLRRRVERSRLLRSQTDGVGVLDPAEAARLGVGGPAARAGSPWDATARWRQWLAETSRLLSGRGPAGREGPRGPLDADRPPSRALLDAAVALMPGLEIGEARVLVASFDPDPEELLTGGRRGNGL